MIKIVKINEIKPNPNNPRIIKDDKYRKLVKSIQDFPDMLKIRPIVCNRDMIVLGGNMRLKACKEAGLKEIPIIYADNLTEEQQKEFIIKDNIGFGEWDYAMLDQEWEYKQLDDWGLTIPSFDSSRELLYVEENNNITEKEKKQPDEYAVLEIIMMYENKIITLEILNKIRRENSFEKIEDSIMFLINNYKKGEI
jgi:ParB-like chromosome segregation protein Spo0J